MKVAFYCPLKPISHPSPSGDREIARRLYQELSKEAEVFVLSEFKSRFFYRSVFSWVSFIAAFIKAYRLAKAEKPDVYFTYHLYYKAPDPIGFLLAWWFQKPFVVYEGMYSRKKARRLGSFTGFWLTHLAFSYATKIYCNKTRDFHFLEIWFPEKTKYVSPSIDLEPFSQPQDRAKIRKAIGLRESEIVIATVAMLRRDRKSEGVRFLLRCLGKLRREGFEFSWLHLGGGPERSDIERLALDELGPQAKMMGEVPADQVAAYLMSADIYAFPGINEGLGMAYLEAQAAGLPVVAMNNGGIPDLVQEGGILTDPNEDAFTDGLRKLLESQELREEMGAKAKRFAWNLGPKSLLAKEEMLRVSRH